ncbi:MAG: DUF4982 domain-containing protein [Clostridiales bacterium]|nr:DUF4982 domain-containing protein [Clostridiales bacterium]
MKSVDLNSSWSVTVGDEVVSCDLPYDATAGAARDYACAFGELNGYIPSVRAVFTRTLPQIKNGNGLVDIKITGVCGYGEVFVNDKSVGSLNYGYAPYLFTVDLSGSRNTIKIVLNTSPEMSDKYLGLGIAGGVELVTLENAAVYGIDYPFVKTAVVGGRVYADAEVTVFNDTDKPQKFVIDCTVLNARGKRAGKKQRKIFLRAKQNKTLDVRVRITAAYEWSPSDPYMYSLVAKLIPVTDESAEVCSVTTRFGIVSRALSATRGLYINNRKTLLMGAYLSHADVALGAVSLYCNEKRKLEALKAIGYNAVHFVGCPTAATLDACDDVGMFAFVDLFPHLGEAKAPLGGIFTDRRYYSVFLKIAELRNHPSVTVYGVADDVPECYDRYDGHELIKAIADRIKEIDSTRPVTVSTREQVPFASELEKAGCRKTVFDNAAAAINAGREKNLFEDLTEGAFEAVDVCGFNYLPSLYETELTKRNRLLLGSRTDSKHAFDSLDATEKNDRVIGDFNDCGMDYPGGGKLNENITTRGDLDAIGCERPQSVYKRVLLGERGIAYIVVRDPDSDEPVHMWNWPRYLGQKVNVDVYTSGDVVALYLDGRIVGRRLAGKVNKYIASFSVDYYPGTLEAVAYFKGKECARSILKSAGSPKTLKLTAYAKNLSVSRGDVGFVYIDVCDRDGELVPYAMRELNVAVTGGELIAFVNADPMLRKNSFDSCPAYEGKALAVIRPDPGENKAIVKVTGDGLLAARVSFKIKN